MNPIVFAQHESGNPVQVSIDSNCRYFAQLVEKLQPKLALQDTPQCFISVHFNDKEFAGTDEVEKFLTSRTKETDALVVKTQQGKLHIYTNRFRLPGRCCGHKGHFWDNVSLFLFTKYRYSLFLLFILRFDTVCVTKASVSSKLRFYTNRFCLHSLACCGHKGMFTLLHFFLC